MDPLAPLAAATVEPLVRDIGMCLLFAGALSVLFARLRIPTIAALLFAGVLLGPETPGSVVDRDSIATIANLGIVLLLFLIGLGLDFRKLLASGRVLLLTGLFQFPLCVAVGWGVSWLAARAGWEGVAGSYVPLYIGFVVSGSSTLVIVRLLQERGQVDTALARTAVGISILQDIWSIVVLAAQPNFADPRLGTVAWSFLGIGIVAVTAFGLARSLVPLALRWIAMRPELLLVATAGWCFGIGLFGQSLGKVALALGIDDSLAVSMEMGALLAGAAVASHPFSSHIVSRLTVVHDFFITLFFVALGAGIPKPEGATVLLLTAFMVALNVALRYAVFLPLLYVTGMDRRNAVGAATKLIPISEFCLVIAYLGLGLGHVDAEFVGAVIFSFVATALLTPFVFDAGDRIHAASARLLSALGMKEPPCAVEVAGAAMRPDVVLLGFHRTASSAFHEIGLRRPDLLPRTLVLDLNAALHPEIARRGAVPRYGDLASIESLAASGAASARVAVCTVPDDLLRGTTNARLVGMLRSLSPDLVILSNAITLQGVCEQYEAGADYVFVPRLTMGAAVAEAVDAALAGRLGELRDAQEAGGDPADRREVLP